MKKNAIITGASSELGTNVSKMLEENYNLILLTNNNKVNTTIFSSKPIIIECDFNDESNVNETIKFIKQHYNVDLIINVAARSQDNNIEDINSEEFLKILTINVVTPFRFIQQLMKEGIVINICSTDGIDTFNEYNITYATSKAALIHLTKQLAFTCPKVNIYGLALNYINTKTTKEMDPNFLQQEMKRVNQEKLIEIDEITNKIKEILIELPPSGSIIRMD